MSTLYPAKLQKTEPKNHNRTAKSGKHLQLYTKYDSGLISSTQFRFLPLLLTRSEVLPTAETNEKSLC